MEVNEIINIRAWIQDCDNLVRRDFEGIKKPLSESERSLYSLVTLVIKGKTLFAREQLDGKDYCHDCSHDHRRPVYHARNPVFQNFRNSPIVKKYGKSLNDLHQIIY